MLVRLTSHTGDVYENQFVYSLKIRTAASCLLMPHASRSKRATQSRKFHAT